MDKVLRSILEEYTINSAPIISKATEPLRKHFNIDVFYHVYVNAEGDYWWAGSHAECSHYVAEKQLCLHAPHIMHPSKILSGYLYPDKLTHIPYYKQLVDTHQKILQARNLYIYIKIIMSFIPLVQLNRKMILRVFIVVRTYSIILFSIF